MTANRFVVRVSRTLVAVLAVAAATVTVRAASPPPFVDFTGVLTDPSGSPLNGTYNITFRFYDAPAGGNHILTDAHLVGGAGGVVVFGGLHRVALGSGAVSDGAGPGNYTSLAAVFRDYSAVYMEMQIGSETLAGRMRIVSAAYALNADQLDGKDSSEFINTTSATQSMAGHLTVNRGVTASGPGGGGYFSDSDNLGYGFVGLGDYGVSGYGAYPGGMGGLFKDINHTGQAWLADGDSGVLGFGTFAGGIFRNGTPASYTSEAFIGTSNYGIDAAGLLAGAHFIDANGSGNAEIASDERGIFAAGTGVGGWFEDINSSGSALLGYGDIGTYSSGSYIGGYFEDSDNTSWAAVGYEGKGIEAHGNLYGGLFYHDPTGNYSIVGTGAYKIYGTGTVSFVQNHPYEKDKVIVYAAPEGDEVAVYTRGKARLVNGEARVRLGETFALVCNPDIGLTAHVTPRGERTVLSVDELSPAELLVRGAPGASTEFDYLVYGLRIGFESKAIVTPKVRESFLPGDDVFQAEYGGQESLRAQSALARFESMEAAAGHPPSGDRSRSSVLAAAINEGREQFLAARRGAEKIAKPPQERPPRVEAPLATSRASLPEAPLPSDKGAAAPEDSHPSVARSAAAPPAREQASTSIGLSTSRTAYELVPSIGRIEPGDVLVLDPAGAGVAMASAHAADPLVIGCAAVLQDGETAPPEGHAALASSRLFRCRADASFGAIVVGDLLVTSPTPGHAMRAEGDLAAGAILGKAAERLEAGTGLIRVVVTSR